MVPNKTLGASVILQSTDLSLNFYQHFFCTGTPLKWHHPIGALFDKLKVKTALFCFIFISLYITYMYNEVSLSKNHKINISLTKIYKYLKLFVFNFLFYLCVTKN